MATEVTATTAPAVEVTEVSAGTPCWADLATPDLVAARAFYSALFGWTHQVAKDPNAGGYTIFLKDGRAVAAAGPPATDGQPAIWSTYVATDDADSAAGRVEAAGGVVLAPPFDVFNEGRMAVFADPAGAAFSVWQPMAMRGAELFNAPGSLAWTELTTYDPEGAREFYGLVFGWQPEEQQDGPAGYVGWRLGNRIVAGMTPPVDENWPADLPAYWGVYFAVEDADATLARVAELGGTVMVPPRDVPLGRFGMVIDPQGGAFAVIALNRPEQAR